MTDPILLAVGLLIVAGVAAIVVLLLRPRGPVADPAAEERLVALNARLDGMANWLQNAHGQLQQTVQASQGQFQQSVNQRLDAVTARLGESLTASTNTTAEHLQNLHARLAVIDSAQKNIADLAGQMTSLQTVLASKQQRGAFGQGRMEIIIQDALPKDCYEFQYTLSNKSRPDCCVFMPDKRPLVIDAKFPLEAVTRFREAKTEEERALAARQLRHDIGKHVSDIAEKYLVPGETQDMALMFVPSESVYAELYDGFDDIVQKAYRAKVVIVSPSLLMLAVQVIQQIQKDARMREAADKIHAEVGHLMDDLGRLRERVNRLGTHFTQANEDVRQILISAEKVEKRGARIRDVEFESEDGVADALAPPVRALGAAE